MKKIIAFLVSAVFSTSLFAFSGPQTTSLKSSIQDRVLVETPQFQWSQNPTGVQQNWQVQVGMDPINWNANTTYWDSGYADKGAACCNLFATMNTPTPLDFCSTFPSPTPCYGETKNLDARWGWSYFRVRQYVDGVWSDFSSAYKFRMNQIQMAPTDVFVDIKAGPSTDPFVPYPPVVAGVGLFVATTGSNTANNCQTEISPCLTITKALDVAAAGDTIYIAAGTYTESVWLNTGLGFNTGTVGNPIKIVGAGATTIWKPATAATGYTLKFGGTMSNFYVNGIAFGGTTNVGGRVIWATGGAHDIYFDGILQETTLSAGSITTDQTDFFCFDNGAYDIFVYNSVFSKNTVHSQVEFAGAYGISLIHNTFTACQKDCIVNHGGYAMQIIGNDFHNITTTNMDGIIFLYLNTDGTRVEENIFYGISGGAALVALERTNNVIVQNNTMYNCPLSAGVVVFGAGQEGLWGANLTIRNNIFSGLATGIGLKDLALNRAFTNHGIVDYNLFYNNNTNNTIPSNLLTTFQSTCTMNALPDGWTCLQHAPTGNIVGLNPLFTNAGSADFTIPAGSPARDTGDPTSNILAQSDPRDIGRYEYGIAVPTPSYFYVPDKFDLAVTSARSVDDTTPTVSWTFNDMDNIITTIPGSASPVIPPTPIDLQYGYQVQISKYVTFDDYFGKAPFLDSGQVISSQNYYTVPDDLPLDANANYYVRVRTRDAYKNVWSNWSEIYAFGVPVDAVPGGGNGSGGTRFKKPIIKTSGG